MEPTSVFAGLRLWCDQNTVRTTRLTRFQTKSPTTGRNIGANFLLRPGRSSKFLNRDEIFCSQNGGVASLSAQATSVS